MLFFDTVLEMPEAPTYPVRDVHQQSFGQADAEIGATLYATTVVGEDTYLKTAIGERQVM